ncbi:hypothetical protein DIS24_g1076 [Lasiodiplodia hormozganensis]|uniref:Occluded RNA-recognition motif domain-containing protein n=1 Tax=Lasiodiplodia hormozganensis TaxID=869390 RepID=A0AA39Z4P7_9PEZI|nr:hypothetical protein DIS24_g1076 [Lasiodiplodia hormozganensis]
MPSGEALPHIRRIRYGEDAKDFLRRILRTTISEPKGSKRHATAIISQPSASPEPTGDSTATTDMNGTTTSSSADPAKDRHERTIALLNIPDTVNDARTRSMVEPHGSLKEIICESLGVKAASVMLRAAWRPAWPPPTPVAISYWPLGSG